ncbi:hypothetical protein AB6C54_23550 [Vibrio splendidus]
MSSSYTLFKQIIDLSRARNWDEAKKEWRFKDFSQGIADVTCLCGKCSISKVFTLHNRYTESKIGLGSSCIRKFIPFTDKTLRNNAIEVLQDNTKQFHLNIMNQCVAQGIIDQIELFHYLPVRKRKSIEPRKLEHRIAVNKRVASSLMDICNL